MGLLVGTLDFSTEKLQMMATSTLADVFCSLLVCLKALHIITGIPGKLPARYKNSGHDFKSASEPV